jgi:hypothetical protein
MLVAKHSSFVSKHVVETSKYAVVQGLSDGHFIGQIVISQSSPLSHLLNSKPEKKSMRIDRIRRAFMTLEFSSKVHLQVSGRQ